MFHSNRGFATAIAAALTLFVTTAPGLGADLGPEPRYQPAPPLANGSSASHLTFGSRG
jgi:hypothetical protein